MRTRSFLLPPPTPRDARRQQAIISTMALSALAAYAGCTVALLLLTEPTLRAIQGGSLFPALLDLALLVAAYAIAGGVLCSLFVTQLSAWPPPRPRLRLRAIRFVRSWPWAAAQILIELCSHALERGGH